MSTTTAEQGKKAREARCGPGGIRPSRAGKWRALTLFAVHLLIAAHVVHWIVSGETLSPLEPSEAMEFFKHGVVNAGLLFFAATVLLTGIFGRWFCGWGCHVVALQDGSRWLLAKFGIRPRPLKSRLLLIVPVLAFVYMFLWPLAARMWLGDELSYRSTNLMTENFWATFPPWPIAVATLLAAGFAIIYFLGAKGFCTYACPYGAIYGAVERFAPGRIRVTDACEGCGHCTAVCSSNVVVHAEVRDYGAVVDPGCMKCLDCVSVCPNDALYFGFGAIGVATSVREERGPRAPAKPLARSKLARWKEQTLGEEALLGVTFVLAFLTFRGLYGQIPFLFSLSIAAMLAYLSLHAARLVHAKEARVQRWTLKSAGRITRAGRVFAGAMALVAVFWAHSGVVRVLAWRTEGGWERTIPLREAWFSDPQAALEGEQRELAEGVFANASRLAGWSLLADDQNFLRIAWMHLLLGRGGEFERLVAQRIEQDPESVSLRVSLAEFHAARGEGDAAFALFEQALTLDPSLGSTYQRLGLAAQALAQLGRAADVFEGFAAADAENVSALHNLAIARAGQAAQLRAQSAELRARGQEEPATSLDERAAVAQAAALDAYRRTVQLAPGLISAREDLAFALFASGQTSALRESLTHYAKLLSRRPENPGLHLELGQVHFALGELEAAENALEEVTRLAPTLIQAWVLLGQIQEARGRSEAARESFQRARSLAPPPRSE